MTNMNAFTPAISALGRDGCLDPGRENGRIRTPLSEYSQGGMHKLTMQAVDGKIQKKFQNQKKQVYCGSCLYLFFRVLY